MDYSAHLHFKLKMLILPLPAKEITRNADSDRLPKGGARPQRTRDQVLERKRQDGIREVGRGREKKSTWREQDVKEGDVWLSNKRRRVQPLFPSKHKKNLMNKITHNKNSEDGPEK